MYRVFKKEINQILQTLFHRQNDVSSANPIVDGTNISCFTPFCFMEVVETNCGPLFDTTWSGSSLCREHLSQHIQCLGGSGRLNVCLWPLRMDTLPRFGRLHPQMDGGTFFKHTGFSTTVQNG